MDTPVPRPLEISVRDAHRAIEHGTPLVDIRTEAERQVVTVSGSIAMTSNEVQARCAEDATWRANLLCAGGARSLILAATLRRQGKGDLASVAGGIDRWKAAGLPVEHRSSLGSEPSSRREAACYCYDRWRNR